MNFELYQKEQLRTVNKLLTYNEELDNAIMGLRGESGEVVDLFKKHLYQGHPLKIDKIIEEMGDVLWYISYVSHLIGLDLKTIMNADISTLNNKILVDKSEINKSLLSNQPQKLHDKSSQIAIAIRAHIYENQEIDYSVIAYTLKELIIEFIGCCNIVGTNIEEVAKNNMEKLKKRYPGNSFSIEESINRAA